MHDIQRKIPERVQLMFDAIAPTYDTLNHMLSFGLDIRWRTKAISLLKEKAGGTFLDIAAGSGDVSLELMKLSPRQIIGTDFSFNMLRVFQKKNEFHGEASCIDIVSCDALALPYRDHTFDATIVAFGIRNFADRLLALQEMHRVLKATGISVILELSTPTAPVILQLYQLYSRIGLPVLGRIISKHNAAYQYLPDSIAQFPDQHEFVDLMRDAGFKDITTNVLTFGAATIYYGRKAG